MSEDEYDYGVLQDAPTDYYDIPAAEDKEEAKEDLNSKFEELKRKNEDLEKKLTDYVPRNYEQTYAPPASHAPTSTHPVSIAPAITEAFWKDPGQTLEALAMAAKNQAREEVRAELIPLAAMNVRTQIQFYKQGAHMDPEVQKEFDKLINAIPDTELARADHKQIQNQLEMLSDMAHGKAAKSGWVPQAARQIPNYGGGRNHVPPKPGVQRMQLSKLQQQALDAAKAVPGFDKWSPKEVAAFLKEYEN